MNTGTLPTDIWIKIWKLTDPDPFQVYYTLCHISKEYFAFFIQQPMVHVTYIEDCGKEGQQKLLIGASMNEKKVDSECLKYITERLTLNQLDFIDPSFQSLSRYPIKKDYWSLFVFVERYKMTKAHKNATFLYYVLENSDKDEEDDEEEEEDEEEVFYPLDIVPVIIDKFGNELPPGRKFIKSGIGNSNSLFPVIAPTTIRCEYAYHLFKIVQPFIRRDLINKKLTWPLKNVIELYEPQIQKRKTTSSLTYNEKTRLLRYRVESPDWYKHKNGFKQFVIHPSEISTLTIYKENNFPFYMVVREPGPNGEPPSLNWDASILPANLMKGIVGKNKTTLNQRGVRSIIVYKREEEEEEEQ